MSKINMQKSNGNDLSLDEVFEKFVRHCHSKNLSERTIGYYEENYEQFKEILKSLPSLQSEDILRIDHITPQKLEKYRLRLLERDISDKTVNSYLRAVRAFLYYAMNLGYLGEFDVQLVKSERKIKKTYTDEELEILLEKPEIDNCNFAEYRNWVIVNWLISTGNRARNILVNSS